MNADGSLTPYTLTGPDESHAWSLDAWLKIGRFDLIGEYLAGRVRSRTTPGVAPTFTELEEMLLRIAVGFLVVHLEMFQQPRALSRAMYF